VGTKNQQIDGTGDVRGKKNAPKKYGNVLKPRLTLRENTHGHPREEKTDEKTMHLEQVRDWAERGQRRMEARESNWFLTTLDV